MEVRDVEIETLQLILKVSERCNIACTYRYFFFRGGQSYQAHAPVLTEVAQDHIFAFLEREIAANSVKRVSIALHGGEPLLMKKARFETLLEKLTRACAAAQLRLSVQTNGMLVDPDWIALFSRFRVQVGVSLDGPASVNDRSRIDKKGRGTHARSVAGLSLCVEAARAGKLDEPGVLCVMDPDADPVATYLHFVDELGVRNIDFLFPDEDHDSFDPDRSGRFGAYLCKILDTRLIRGDTHVHIRVLDHLQYLITRDRAARARNREAQRRVKVATLSSNATIGLDDILRSIAPGRFQALDHVTQTSLQNVFSGPEARQVDEAEANPPAKCSGCLWLDVCGGGLHAIHRHSAAGGFDNPSVYCEDIKAVLGRMVRIMHASGVPARTLGENLA